MIITDSNGLLGSGKKWKRFLGRLFIPPQLSEQDKHNQNPVKHTIQKLKAGLSKIINACGTGVLPYHWQAIKYPCSLNNYVAQASLGKRLPFEAFWGNMPDISMIRFKFWETVFYRNWTDKAGKVIINPGRFVGFAWIIGDPMTFKVLLCNEDLRRRDIIYTDVS